VAAFPLLLLHATILGYALHGNPHLQRQVLDSALAQFPVIGGQVTGASLGGGARAIADQRAYTSYAKTERHKSFENIDVSFGERPHPGSGEPPS
jgi:hypothetical protein